MQKHMELIMHRLTQQLGRGRISEDDVVEIQPPGSKGSIQEQLETDTVAGMLKTPGRA